MRSILHFLSQADNRSGSGPSPSCITWLSRSWTIVFASRAALQQQFVKFLLIVVLLIPSLKMNAEGTRQLEPSTGPATQYCKMYFDNDLGQFRIPFAQLGCPSDYRLYFYIDYPATEVVYFGFGSAIDYGNIAHNDLQFQIKDPSDNVVSGFTMAPLPVAGAGFISTNAQAQAGPNISGSVPAGYTPLSFTPTMSGNYYIEFSMNNLPDDINGRGLRYFDLTVANGTTPIDGRLWCKAWQLSSSTTSAGATGKTFASFYSYTADSIVTRFQCNGLAGGIFSVYCNQYGTNNTGNWATDRRSINGNGTVIPEYRLFLNNPDTNIYPSGHLGRICDVSSHPECDGSVDILIKVNRPGTIFVDIDLLPAGAGPEDITLIKAVTGSANCDTWDTIPWNGTNGLGVAVQNGVINDMTIVYLNGLTNLPLYDVEDNRFGIKVDLIRPTVTGIHKMPIYWDDVNVGGSTNLTGCTYPAGGIVTGCHPWTNTNMLTHNSWWYYLTDGPENLTVAVYRTPPAAPSPTGPSQVCQGQTSVTFSIPAQQSTDLYIWNLPDGSVDTTLVPSVTFDIDSTAAASGTISVILNNSNCGNGAASAPFSISVTQTPNPSPNLIVRPCPNKTGDLTTVQPLAAAGTSLQWHTSATSPSGATLVSTPSAVPSGTYYLFAVNSTTGCFSPASPAVVVSCDTCPPVAVTDSLFTSNTLAVTVNILTNDFAGDYAINPATVDLDPATPGFQQTITIPGQGTFTVNSIGVLTFTPVSSFVGIATVPYTINDIYANTSNQASVIVTVGPDGVSVPAYQIICSGDTAIIHLSSSIPGATFTWTVSGPASVTGQTPGSGNLISQILVNNSMSNHTVTYFVTPWYGGIAGPVVTAQVEVTPPVTLTNATLLKTICSGDNTNINLNTSPNNATVSWVASNTGNISGIVPASGTTKAINQTLINNDPFANYVYYNIEVSYYGCVTDPETYTVTVNQDPDVQVSPASSVICSGTSVNLVLTSTIPGTTFSWTASGTAGVSGYSAGNGNTISQAVSTAASVPGTVTYTITPTANGCAGTPVNYQVTVNPVPSVSNPSLAETICSGSSTAISITSNIAAATFTWTASGSAGITGYSAGVGNIIAQTLDNPGNIPGTVTYSITPSAYGCTGSTVDYIVTVNPVVNVTTSPLNQSVCTGYSTLIPLTSNVAGATFSWTASGTPGISGYSAGSGNVISQVLTNSIATPGTVTYTITPAANGCTGVSSSNFIVTVNPEPVIFTMVPTGPQCSGTILRLNGSESGLLYILRLNGISVDTITGTGLVGFLDFGPRYDAGIYDIIAVNPVTGCQALMNGLVQMNPAPDIFSVLPAGILCPGANIGLSGSETGISYQLRWNHMINIGSPVSGTGSPISFGTQIFPGTYTIIAVNPATGCYSEMADSATIYPQPTIYTLTANGTGCPGTSIGLSSSQLLIDYVLLLNGTIHLDTVSGTGNPIDFGPQTTAGSYTILAISQSNFCQILMNGTYVINPDPLVYNLTPAGYICAGQSIGLSGSETGISYQLYNGATLVGSPVAGTGSALDFGPQTTAGVYTVVATNPATGCYLQMANSVTVNPNPVIYSLTSLGAGCPGTTVGLNGSELNTNYILVLDGTLYLDTISGTGNPVDFGPQTTAGTYTILAVNQNSFCQSLMNGSLVMNPNPLVFSLTPAGYICAGQSIGLSGSETGISYQLYNGTTLVGSPVAGTGSALDFGPQTTAGVYTVVATNPATGCYLQMANSVTVNPNPVIYSLTSLGAGCPGTTVGLNGSELNTNYILVLDGTLYLDTISGTGNPVDFGPQTTAGTYTILAVNQNSFCQSLMNGSLVMNPNPLVFSLTPAGYICAGQSIGLSGSETGVSYQLYLGTTTVGSPVAGTGSALDFGPQSITGVYTVVATNPATGCYSQMSGAVNIYPQPTVFTITSTGSGCPGTVIGLSSSQLNVDYVLLLDGSVQIDTISGTGNPIDFGSQMTTGTYTILAISQSTNCQEMMSGSFVINPNPFVFNIVPAGTICVGQSVGLSGSETGVSYQLFNGTTLIGTSIAGTGNALDFGPQWIAGTYTVIAVNDVTGCASEMNDSTVFRPFPTSYAIYPQGTNCSGSNIILNGSESGITYILMLNNTFPVDTLTGTGGILDFGVQYLSGIYTVNASATALTCQSTMSGSTIIVNNPLVYNVIPAGTNCGTANIGLDGSETGVNYELFLDGNPFGIVVAGTGSPVSFGNQYPGTYTVQAVNTVTGCQSAMNGTIVINELPAADAGADDIICENSIAQLSGDAFEYSTVLWTTAGDGTFINPTSLYADYIPGVNDIANSVVTLTLTASNPLCGSASDDMLLSIIPYPVVDAGPDATVCDACDFHIIYATATNTSSVYWITSGTGTFSDAASLNPVYFPSETDYAIGSVILTLTGTGIDMCGEANDIMTLTFDPNPGVDFTWGASCESQSVDFAVDPAATNIGAVASWSWDFGDGGTSLLMNPSHVFPSWGTYNVKLTTTDTTGYVRIVMNEVYVSQPPVAMFSSSVSNCSNEEVQFKDLSFTLYGYIEQWVWNFGDGTPDDTINFPDDPNVKHMFDTTGIYNVTLTIRNSFGCENSVILPVTVITAPIANFYYTGNCASTVVNFSDASFANGSGNVVQWWWNFGDPLSGSDDNSELENPIHTFTEPGTYMVTHIVRNFNNCTDTIVKPVVILPPLDVDFTHTYTCIDELTHFIPDTTVIAAGAVQSWFWDFGDGLTSTDMYASHAFTSTGLYHVTLTITDTNNCVASGSHDITIYALPIANFETEPWLCEDTPVEFTDLSSAASGYIIKWFWDFGNGDTLTVNYPDNPNIQYTYAIPGTYNVTLSIKSTDSCTAEITKSVIIGSTPVANFTFDNNCEDNLTQFTDLSQLNGGGNITGWAWNFGDPASGILNTSTVQNPAHQFASTGVYNVTLTVTTSNGCANEVILPVTVIPAPTVDFYAQQTCAGTSTLFIPASTMAIASVETWFWNFGDGSTSNEQDPGHIYPASGNYLVTLTITDTNGCSNTAAHNIAIAPAPTANFITSQPSCSGSAISFTSLAATQLGYIVKWTWDFGDGASQTITLPGNPNVSHIYSDYGLYNVTLTVVTNDSCQGSTSLPVQVLQSPVANFSSDGSCIGSPVHFNDLSQGGMILTWHWNFGDMYAGPANTSVLQNPQHTYTSAGTYPVTLITENVNGCSDTIIRNVLIYAAPAVDFTFNASCANDTVHFISSASVNVAATAAWLWQFGDGATSTDTDPYHVYAAQGYYNVTLTITDTAGCENSKTRNVPVTQAPVAAFTATTPACSGMSVTFNDISTTMNGTISSWHWNFDDGSDTTIFAPANPDLEHVFAQAGTYNVSLYITTTTGCEDEYSLPVNIKFSPAAAFSVQGNCPVQPAMFTDESQALGGSAIVAWSWSFGDPASGSNTSVLQNPQHIYSQPGTYNVTLEVENMNGCTNSITQPVTVETPSAVAIADIMTSCLGTPVVFQVDTTVTNLADITAYDWDFGDGTAHSPMANPSHDYTNAGTYTVTLVITDINGCTNSDSQPMTVHTLPVAQFSSQSNCLESYTVFSDESYVPDGDPIVSWNWDFGVTGSTNDTSSLQNPVWIYAGTGTYQVTLQVSTLSGCTATVISEVTVKPAPVANFTYITEPCHQGSVSFTDSSYAQQSVVTNWYWEFESNNYSTLQNPTYVFMNTNTYYDVKLIITNAEGCTDTIIKPVYVPSGLNMTFSFDETCFGDTTRFTPQLLPPVLDSIATYAWSFGDPNTGIYNQSNLRYPTHKFLKAGTYVVTLTVTTTSFCTATVNRQIEIIALPNPKFEYTGGDCNDVVEFQDKTSGNNLTQWIWEFGDGTSMTINAPSSPDVTHSYPNTGLYFATLTVTNAHGCVNAVTDSVKRLPCISSEFTINDTTACQNRSMHFTDMSTCAGPIAGWMWDFGDGTTQTYTSQQAVVSHTYATAGSYTVRLIVNTQLVGGIIAADTSTKPLKVFPAPKAEFIWNDICLGTTTEFKNTTRENGLKVNDYTWNFDDPTSIFDTASMISPTYLYSEAGGYNVRLVAGNTMGCTDTIVQTVNVFDSPKAAFDWLTSCDGDPVQFIDNTDTASAKISTWNWIFHDEAGAVIGASTKQNPSFDFTRAGLFSTELSVKDKHGCTGNTVNQIAINSSPVAAFTIKDNYEDTQGQIQLLNGTLNATNYLWDFGDGKTSFSESPVTTYDKGGSYTITLVTWNGQNCTDTLTMNYELTFKGLYIPNAFSPDDPHQEVRIFKPVGMNLKKYRIEVIDRWGNTLWTSDKLDKNGCPAEGWDGTLNSVPVQSGVYMWRASAIFIDGTKWDGVNVGDKTCLPQTDTGTVTLIR
ncbi:MAG TPA: PKD domain-containing protein [Bacteroidales bacterium]|nr:PKD domain-containing protein [Bacteroidales bacterium]